MAKDKNKNMIEEAWNDIETIQEALKSNAGEIFRTVAKEEIEELMEGRLNEDDDEFEEEEISDEDSNEEETSEDDNEEDSLDIELDGTESSDEETDTEINLGDDMEGDLESQDDTELDINLDTEDEIDLTGATEDEVIKVYKRLRDNDEIDIVSDNEVKLTDDESGNEYSIKTDSNEMNESNDETVYRITLDEDYHTEDMDETKINEKDLEESECEAEDENDEDVVLEIELDDEELEENLGATRGYAGRQGAKKTGSAHHPKRRDESKKETKNTVSESEYKNKYEKLINEFNNLKTENKQFKNLLKTFKTKLAETAVFNTNLAHATKLFVEHTTNKAEKETILKRFDEEANTIEESKKLFKSIVNDLGSKKTMTESLDEKMVSKQQKVSSDKNINEQTAYVDPEIQNIIGLMDKIN